MQVTETLAEGLRREYKVVIPATDMDRRIEAKLKEISRQVRLPGFRPGKVPLRILKQRYGSSVLGQVLESTVNETSRQTMTERGIRPAMQPKLEVTSFGEGTDLEYTMALELMPDIDPVDLAAVSLERPVALPTDETIDEMIGRLAHEARSFEPIADPRPSKGGDKLVIDYRGRIDGGEPRDDMTAEGAELELGSNRFIPGFEDQLSGVSVGDEVEVRTTFPDDYGSEEHAGQVGVFDVKVKEIQEPQEAAIDDTLATRYGYETLDALRTAVRERTEQDYRRLSRARVKRKLLDQLADAYHFVVPEGMVEVEFNSIWTQVQEALSKAPDDDPDKQKSEDQLREEYGQIAERRVRLGLLLAEVGRQNNVSVSQDELNRAVAGEMRRFPGQEKQVLEFFQNNTAALENLRAPLFEDKVVDFMLEIATVTDKEVSVEELLRDPDDEAPGPSTETAPVAAGAPDDAPPDESAPADDDSAAVKQA